MSIVYEGKDGSRRDITPVALKKRKGLVAGIAAGCVGIVALVGVGCYLYFGQSGSSGAFDSPEAVADKVAEYTIAGDMDSLFNLQEKRFQQRSMSDIRMTYDLEEDSREEAVKRYQKAFDEGVYPIMVSHYGDTVKVSYTVGDYAAYSDEAKKELELSYRMQGVDDEFTCDGAGVVPVTLHLSSENGMEPMDSEMLVPVIEIGGDWSLAQCVTNHYTDQVPEYTAGQPWMDILDGFHIVGEFDSEANRVYRQQEEANGIPMSTQIFMERDGKKKNWYYEDSYRNKVYVDVEVTDQLYGQVMATPNGIVKGPDGGEALTEETYDEYWNNYYEEENRKWLEEHPEAAEEMRKHEEAHKAYAESVSGNNVVNREVPDVVQPDGVSEE